jgi:hypothetical protein
MMRLRMLLRTYFKSLKAEVVGAGPRACPYKIIEDR